MHLRLRVRGSVAGPGARVKIPGSGSPPGRAMSILPATFSPASRI